MASMRQMMAIAATLKPRPAVKGCGLSLKRKGGVVAHMRKGAAGGTLKPRPVVGVATTMREVWRRPSHMMLSWATWNLG